MSLPLVLLDTQRMYPSHKEEKTVHINSPPYKKTKNQQPSRRIWKSVPIPEEEDKMNTLSGRTEAQNPERNPRLVTVRPFAAAVSCPVCDPAVLWADGCCQRREINPLRRRASAFNQRRPESAVAHIQVRRKHGPAAAAPPPRLSLVPEKPKSGSGPNRAEIMFCRNVTRHSSWGIWLHLLSLSLSLDPLSWVAPPPVNPFRVVPENPPLSPQTQGQRRTLIEGSLLLFLFVVKSKNCVKDSHHNYRPAVGKVQSWLTGQNEVQYWSDVYLQLGTNNARHLNLLTS